MKKTFWMLLLSACSLSSMALNVADFNESEFTDGIPEGWVEAEQYKTSASLLFATPQTVGGKKAFTLNFYSALSGERVIYREEPLPGIDCDNISVAVPVYMMRNLYGSVVDKIQVVLSTNNYESLIEIGNPIVMQEPNRASDAWVTNKVSRYVPGLSAAGNSVQIGLKAMAGGRSGKFGYIQGLNVDFVATATPSDVMYVTEKDGSFSEIDALEPGMENVRLSVTVNTIPEGRVTSTNVYAVISRNGMVTTNALSYLGGSRYISESMAPMLDAGEKVDISIYSAYTTDGLPTLGDCIDNVAYEYVKDVLSDEVTKKGSVWINEVVMQDGALSVEFAGTTNREITAGWKIAVSNDVHQEELLVTGKLDFKKKTINKVIGLDVRNFDAAEIAGVFSSGTNVLKLVNSRGIIESVVQVVNDGDWFSYGMTGIAVWHEEEGYDYDWSGASDGVFDWNENPLEDASMGALNVNQGFKIPFSAKICVKATTELGKDMENAAVFISVSNIANVAGTSLTTTNVFTSADGVAEVVVDGYSCVTDKVFAVVSASAFGWAADNEPCELSLTKENKYEIELIRSAVFDDCDSIQSYWINTNFYKWVPTVIDNRRCLQINLYSALKGTNSLMTCANSLYAGEKKYMSVAFDFKNSTANPLASYNELCVQICTNSTWVGEVKDVISLSNKRSGYSNGEWYTYKGVAELPEAFQTSELYVRLLARTIEGRSSAFIYLDNLHLSFQDVAMPTNLTMWVDGSASAGAPESGQCTDFSLDVVPQTSDTVKDVTAYLYVRKNGETEAISFSFPDGAKSSDISLDENGEQKSVRLWVSDADICEAFGQPFLTGDEVTYYAAVQYDPANGDPEKTHEMRCIPDNATTNGIYWIVEGEYGVNPDLSANTFTVDGPPLSIIDDIVVTTHGATFTIHGFAEDGISNLTVNVNGENYNPFEGLETNAQKRVTGFFDDLSTGLAANTEYTGTITAEDVNGVALTPTPVTFTFVTLPEAPTAVITGTASNEVTLVVSGDAAGYVVPDGWTQTSTNTWTRSGTPNSEPFTARVCATNKVGGASFWVDATPGRTLAAVATKSPVIKDEIDTEEDLITVEIKADENYSAGVDGNPENTQYAVRVTTSAGGDAVVSEGGAEIWRTLADWRENPVTLAELRETPVNDFTPAIDLAATNTFSFITRNFDEVPTPNDDPAATNCYFDMKTSFVDGKAEQTATPFGVVKFSLSLFDPAKSNVTAEVEYSINDGEWQALQTLEISFGDIKTTSTNLEWNAWETLKKATGEYTYKLRARIVCEARSSEWAEVSGALDFAPPAGLAITGIPADGAIVSSTGYDFAAAATDTNAFTYKWILDGTVVDGAHGDKLTGAAAHGQHTLKVIATDVMGNASETTRSWTVDTVKPAGFTLTGEPEDAAFVADNKFEFSASATDDTALKYRWSLNGAIIDNVTSEYAGEVAEGTNTVSVYAEDAAGNVCEAITRTWVVDMTKPTTPVISGPPANGQHTREAGYSFAAVAEDATPLEYHWIFDGSETIRDAFAGALAENGTYVVRAYAKDAAGNVSATNTLSWTYDTVAPTVTLSSETPELFNEAAAPMKVLVEFSETVVNFTKDSITVDNAAEVVVKATDAANVYMVEIMPKGDGAVNVSIKADAVTDRAGNGVVGSATLTRTYDNENPRVESLSSETPEWFNEKKDFVVTVKFSEIVTNFTASSLWVSNGTVNAVAPTVPADTYTVKIIPAEEGEVRVKVEAGKIDDIAGNTNDEASAELMRKYDNTPPSDLAVTGTPANGCATKENAYNLLASAGDVSDITYHWALGDSVKAAVADGEPFTGTVGEEKTYTVSVYAEDEAGNVSVTNTWSWTYDKTAPTKPEVGGSLKEGDITSVKAFELEAASEDATVITYHWIFGETTAIGQTFADEAGEDGGYEIAVYATDAAGNVSVTNTLSWILDTTPPVGLAISGSPKNGALVNVKTFSLTASAEDATELTYNWTVNGSSSTGASVSGEGKEGANVVVVKATDAAGNISEKTWQWTVDTTKPVVEEISSETPARFNSTKVPMKVSVVFSEPVTNVDASAISVVNGSVAEVVKAEDAANAYIVTVTPVEPEIEGEDVVVSVFVAAGAVADAAGNQNEVSEVLTRTYDVTAPTVALSSETPETFNAKRVFAVKVVFSEAVTNFTHSSLKVVGGTIAEGAVQEIEGEDNAYTVTVVPAGDGKVTVRLEAGKVFDLAENANVASSALSRTYDNTVPTKPVIGGDLADGDVVKVKAFNLEAASEDATAITYHWIFGERTDVGQAFAGEAGEDGRYEISVWAEDAAGNVSATNTLAWTLDTKAPTKPLFGGSLKEGDITNVKAFNLEAASEDATAITYHWIFGEKTAIGQTFEDVAGEDGGYEIAVYATDAAGNVSATNTMSWTLDTKAPENLVMDGTPLANAETKNSAIDLNASADDATEVVYVWILNGEPCAEGNTLSATAKEGRNTVSVYAVDAAGNQSEAVTRSWTLDTTPPTMPEITGNPHNGADTNVAQFDFTAQSEDATAITYHWTFGEEKHEGAKFSGTLEKEGEYTVSVYAEDALGNVSGKNTLAWTYDVTKPTVTLASETPARFNRAKAPIEVSVVFSEPVTNVDASAVSVVNGSVTKVVKAENAANAYIVTVTPAEPENEGEDVVVSVSVAAGAVADAAGNQNEASTVLTRTFDVTAPTATLTSETRDPFGGNDVFTVKVAFSETVTNFTYSSLKVDGGEVAADSLEEVEGEDNAYTVRIVPAQDGKITVQLEAGKVFDLAENANAASGILERTCDVTRPTVELTSSTAEAFRSGSMIVNVAFSEPVTNFTENSIKVTIENPLLETDDVSMAPTVEFAVTETEAGKKYTVTIDPSGDGIISVQVEEGVVADAADNVNMASTVLTRTYDTEKPVDMKIEGTPAAGSVVNEKAFSLTASATDLTEITYRWALNGKSFMNHAGDTLTYEDIKRYGADLIVGENKVTVIFRDAASNRNDEALEYSWTYEPVFEDVDFGGGVTVAVDSDTGATNAVGITTLDIKPGADCSFTLSGFNAATENISNLQLWFIVCDELGGTPWRVKVGESATFDPAKGELTVTLPASATKKNDEEPYGSFFILGIDNKGSVE